MRLEGETSVIITLILARVDDPVWRGCHVESPKSARVAIVTGNEFIVTLEIASSSEVSAT